MFFLKIYSKPFVIICLIVIVLGVVNALYAVSQKEQFIDTKISQKIEEFGKLDQKDKAEYNEQYKNYEGCLLNYRNKYNIDDSIDVPLFRGCVPPFWSASYSHELEDRELDRIRGISSFQIFFENFSFGYLGVIALVAVFFINFLIAFIKFLKRYIFIVFQAGNLRAKSVGINIRDMPAFQRYLLFIALMALIILTFILFRL